MNENEWLASENLRDLLSYVRSGANLTRSKPGRRKMRLFACGCCRLIEHLLPDERTLQALRICENYADGGIDEGAREAARLDANRTAAQKYAQAKVKALASGMEAARAVWSALDKDGRQAVEFALEFSVKAAQAARRTTAAKGEKGRQAAAVTIELRSCQCDLLRDLFGNPFRPVVFPKHWKTPNIVSLATTIYRKHAFHDLPVLGDALEDAGCTDPDVLLHCRGKGRHFRGCWVLDGIMRDHK